MQRFLAVCFALLIAACGSPPKASRAPNTQIRWLGHGCFQVTNSLGLSLVTDPFDPQFFGYPPPADLRAGVLLISHEGPVSSHTPLVANDPLVVRGSMGVGSNRVSGLLVRGIPLSRAVGLASDTPNTAYVWTMDGIRFCFPGTPADPPDTLAAEAIGPVDVLFLPFGSPSGLSDAERDRMVAALRPRVIIPMAYRTRQRSRGEGIAPLDPWLQGKPDVVRLPGRTLILSRDTLPARPTILIPPQP